MKNKIYNCQSQNIVTQNRKKITDWSVESLYKHKFLAYFIVSKLNKLTSVKVISLCKYPYTTYT